MARHNLGTVVRFEFIRTIAKRRFWVATLFVPVLLIIGYWLAWRRTAANPTEVIAEPVLVPVVPVVDTERGRMS